MFADITKLTGVSKADWSTLLKIDASLLTHFEANKRSLPSRAMLPLVTVYAKKNEVKQMLAVPSTNDAEKKKLLFIAEGYKLECDQLKDKLAAMQLRFEQAQNMLQLLKLPIFQYPFDGELTPRTIRWIDNQQYYAEEKIASSGWFEQKKLMLKIASLEHDSSMYEAAAEEIHVAAKE